MIVPSDSVPTEEDRQVGLADASHVPARGNTLLPRPFASLVSLVTQSTSLSLRVGTFFGGVALDGARGATLTGLELGRAVVEGILTRAGRDIAVRSGDDHGRLEADSLLERSVGDLPMHMRRIMLTETAGHFTYNRDFSIVLCRSHLSFLVYDVGLGCQFLSGSTVNS